LILSDAGYLLDTKVVSEVNRPRPNARVAAFLDQLDADDMFVSVLTVGELRRGMEAKRRTDAVMADRLSLWIAQLERSFKDRVLSIDVSIASLWGRLSAARTRPVVDTLIAATAIVHGMTLVTRNVAGMRDTGVRLVDPWLGGGA
jgi:predicted nucleic acid-binding protein